MAPTSRQNDHDCYFLIADYQISDYADVSRMRESVWEVALDWLARGLPMGLIAGDNVAGYRPPTDGQ